MKSQYDFIDPADYNKYLLTSFTMAAMQGLCANSDLSGWISDAEWAFIPEGGIPLIAINIARATLAELSKHQ